MSSLAGDNTKDEEDLQNKGAIARLQWYRYKTRYREPGTFVYWGYLLALERTLRETFQREIRLESKLQAMNVKQPLLRDDAADPKKELGSLRRHYWNCERQWWECRANFPADTLSRGFNVWRSNPKWYLHRALRQDCAGRGGCCGRDCGCCLKRPVRPDRVHAIGHCTVECGCCEQARGFKLSKEEKELLNAARFPLFDKLEDQCCEGYIYRLRLVSILGLENGSTQNPFELIDE